MKLYIEKESQIEGIKKVFSAFYPFLKIEFYKKPLRANIRSSKRKQYRHKPHCFNLQD